MLPLRQKNARPQDVAFWGESPIVGRQELGLWGAYVNASGIVFHGKSLKIIKNGANLAVSHIRHHFSCRGKKIIKFTY